MKNRKVKALRIVIAVLLIADMALIFAFSAQKAEQSDGTSTGLIEILAKMFYPGFEALEREAQQAVVASFQFVVRKAAHLTEFASLGVLLCAAIVPIGFVWNSCQQRKALLAKNILIGQTEQAETSR